VTLDFAKAAHLYRRAGFGGKKREIDRLVGDEVAEAVEQFFPRRISAPTGSRTDITKLRSWWLKRMASPSRRALQEKMALFYHGHFATGYSVVDDVEFMAVQNTLFRRFALGNFKQLVREVTKDPAMLLFLDGAKNRKGKPNENYGRELMELFTLGVYGADGSPNYTQQDVVELSRALTGYVIDYDLAVGYLSPSRHDEGTKTFFGVTGNLYVEDPTGTLPAAHDVINILFAKPDSDGRPRVARFLVEKLYRFFVRPDPPAAEVTRLADVFVANGFEVAPVLREIFTSDAFYAPEVIGSLVKSPAEYIAQALRTTGARASAAVLGDLPALMGQELFEPPNVAGWPAGLTWINAANLLGRYRFARDVAAGRRGSDIRSTPERLIDPLETSADGIVSRFLDILGAVNVSAGTRAALAAYLGTPNLADPVYIDTKIRGLMGLILQLPNVQVH
jgi:uncharacterized protein (DUF1800 family)